MRTVTAMTPRKIHFFWDGRPLNYLRYQAFASFRKHNPDWEINYWQHSPAVAETWETGERLDAIAHQDYAGRLPALNVQFHQVTELFTPPEGMASVHISDLFGYKVLADIGGSQGDVCAAFEEVVRVTAPATLWQPAFALTDSGEFMGESCVIAAIDTDETPNVVRLGVFTLENSPIGMIESGNAEATVIDGLGDKAYHLAAFPAVVVQIGETVVMVRNADGGSMPGSEVAIAQGLVAAITA